MPLALRLSEWLGVTARACYATDTARTALGFVRAIAKRVRAAPLGCLRVKSRLFVDTFDEQFWPFFLPRFQCLNRCLVLQGALRDEVVVS